MSNGNTESLQLLQVPDFNVSTTEITKMFMLMLTLKKSVIIKKELSSLLVLSL